MSGVVIVAALVVLLLMVAGRCSDEPSCGHPIGPVPCSHGGTP